MTQLVNAFEVLKSISDATAALVSNLSKSIVSVNSRMSRGTGVVLNDEGYIVTCNHVLAGCNKVTVGQGEKTFEAKIVGADAYNDIALLKADEGSFKPVEFGDSGKLNTGQFVLALANPFNRAQPTATTGIVTNPDSTIRQWRGTAMDNVIATDAKLNPGFSGGPLVDASGKMIGINTAYVWSRGIAIPANKVRVIADRLMNGGEIKKGYLGVSLNTVAISPELAEEAGIDQETGVMIFSVERGSPASKARLSMGDVIVQFNGAKVRDFYDLPKLLTENVIDKETKVTVLRGGVPVELTVKPIAAEDDGEEND